MRKWIYFFGEGKAEGKRNMKEILGGKGANLAEMTNTKLPVPPGFTITTEACTYYSKNKKWPTALKQQVKTNVRHLEKIRGKGFGSSNNPLLVSVRSGARVSMPGMMDTVLNLGLNDGTVIGLANKTGNARMAYDSYRRFINMFSDVVMGVSHEYFEHEMNEIKLSKGVKLDTELSVDDLKELVGRYEGLVKKYAAISFPQNPWKQLELAINAVFKSWDGKRAVAYRRINSIPDKWGTAVNVQAMVFGNMGASSGTGVAFTRNPATGQKEYYGECLVNAQGEDVVAGIRTPMPIKSLEEVVPKVYKELLRVYDTLEGHYHDMQDFEFTIEEGRLYILQTRNGKRTAQAAVKVAVDMVKEGLITKDEALLMVPPEQLNHLLHKQIDPDVQVDVLTKGLPASPGAAVGKIVFTAEDAVEWTHNRGEKVILVRNETSPEDIEGMNVARGILTAKGGMTSHAAVVARGMGKCCVAGCDSIHVDDKAKKFIVRDLVFNEGDVVSLNGNTGEVISGLAKLIEPKIIGEFKTFMQWADSTRRLGVRTNADTPKDAKVALDFGAEGIGLCRTEHMFFEGDRIKAMRQMIIAKDIEGRKKALARIQPMQQKDFEGLFTVMDGLPVTIRLLDPPLHEFLPTTHKEIVELSHDMGISSDELEAKVRSLHELNPMLGHRGCRLAITYPEICEMQAYAIFEAAVAVKKRGIKVKSEVMIPLISDVSELTELKSIIIDVASRVMSKHKIKIPYLVGTMIEIPRATLTADKIAQEADFFSFGTNDLTQMTFGLSRDDVGKFIPYYIEKCLFDNDPFQVLDRTGVGQLIEIGVKKGRAVKKDLKIGICGEHGGEPSSVEFCHIVGMDYVSCSPYRIPIARLAAAQAQIKYSSITYGSKAKGGKKMAKKKAKKKATKKKVKKKATKKKKK